MRPLKRQTFVYAGDSDEPVPVGDDVEIWSNATYQVTIHRSGPFRVLSIKPLSKEPRRDWREFQQIKNQLVGEDAEAVELYPAEVRLVDTANQFFLLALPAGFRFPFGFAFREVSEHRLTKRNTQRRWNPSDRPPDLMTREEAEQHVNRWDCGPIAAIRIEDEKPHMISSEGAVELPTGEEDER